MAKRKRSGGATPATGAGLGARIGKVARLYPSQKKAAAAAGVGRDQLRRYINEESEPTLPAMIRLCGPVGASLEWIAHEAGEMRHEIGHALSIRQPGAPHIEEPSPGYSALNLERLALVAGATELLLPGWSARDRSNVVALAYDVMTAKNSVDPEVLAAFFRQWAKTALAQPPVPDFHSPEVSGSKKNN